LEREVTSLVNTPEIHENSITDLIPVEEILVSGGSAFCFWKRVFDVTAALLGGLLLLPLMLLIALIIRLEVPGPVLYRQERLGLNRKPFIMYKFRSMQLDAERDGPRWAEIDDQRATKVGRFLRKARLDELPQLWNILRGDMSFVGPRPERAYFYKIFESYIPNFGKRMLVLPGLTGWAQVNGGYDLAAEEKIIYDLEYIRNRSFKMDLLCLLKTVKLVFTHQGAR
jgi:exopolysaccharide biosynthesis polyprenyl glycosylphosphotransferase